MSLKLTTEPTAEPLSLSEVKSFLRLDVSDDDPIVTMILSSARKMAEQYTLRSFITQTYDLWMDRWPSGKSNVFWDGIKEASATILSSEQRFVVLPMPPLISVTHVKTYDNSDAATTFASTNYIVDTDQNPGRIILKNSSIWPLDLRAAKAINIQYVAGYGSSGTSVPAAIRQAILMICAKLYETRGEDGGEIPGIAKQLLAPFRILKVGDYNVMPKGYL